VATAFAEPATVHEKKKEVDALALCHCQCVKILGANASPHLLESLQGGRGICFLFSFWSEISRDSAEAKMLVMKAHTHVAVLLELSTGLK
jgi:hypothetical protein